MLREVTVKHSVDINADVGESFGPYTLGRDEEVMPHITSANIACGMHAGDPAVMEKAVSLAARWGVAVGAHPGYPDREGFGRRDLAMSPGELASCVIYQVGALWAFCRARGVELSHVKPHGAMYNRAVRDGTCATAVAGAVKAVDPSLVLFGPAGSELVKAGLALGLRCAREVFADRAYNPDGSLVSRNLPGAVIHDPRTAVSRAVRMVTEKRVETVAGGHIPVAVDSICVHGDNPAAVELAASIKAALLAEGIAVRPA